MDRMETNGNSAALKRSTRTAFTIVELLVVISIVVLLIALLLPALAQAKHMALRVECASNLRSLGLGCKEYAQEFAGRYPAVAGLGFRLNNAGGYYDPYGFWPFGNMCGTNLSPAITPPGNGPFYTYGQYAPWGLGLLYSTQTVKTPTTYYCPEGNVFTPSDTSIYIGSLGQTGGPSDYFTVYLGYCYYYQRAEANYWGGGSALVNPTTQQYQKSLSVPPGFAQTQISDPGTILASDIMVSPPTSAKWYSYSNHFGQNGINGGNVLYNDGSVSWINAGKLHCRLIVGGLNFWQ